MYKAQCAYLIAKIRNYNYINIHQTFTENDRKTYFAKRSIAFEFF